ncbi:MAG TPA: thiosulfate oxidation carrier complex protein SoxZ, partial [Burkholderiales bacterium]|nr:thiosulfate oxidation carrier complex protein SoxZ [Burkholderiales bacterium]
FLYHTAALMAANAGFARLTRAAPDHRRAFDARTLVEALGESGAAGAVPAAAIELKVPAFSDAPAVLPVEVASAIPRTDAIAVFIDRNPFPYIARFEFSADCTPYAAFRARIAESSVLRVVAFAGDTRHGVAKQVQASAGACSADDAEAPEYPVPPPPIRARAQSEGEGALVRALLRHPMENGLRRLANGAPIPERYIQRFDVRLNGRTVLSAQFGRSMSQDPLIGFRLVRAKPGDALELRWQDSHGVVRSDVVVVSA